MHTYASGNADDISAIQNRPDRVQALLDNRQDNQCQSRPPQSDAPRKRRTRVAETKPLSQITWPRNVAHQSPEDNTPPHQSGENFPHVVKGAGPGLAAAPGKRRARMTLTRMRRSSRRSPGGPSGGRCAPGRVIPAARRTGWAPQRSAQARELQSGPSSRRPSVKPGKITCKGDLGRNKTEVRAKLAELHDELNDGVVSDAGYTVAQAIGDYLADGLPGRAPKTIRTQRKVLGPLLPILGNVPLRELTAADVRSALIMLAATRATRTVSMTHAALARAIRHAEASDKVRRNVAALIDSPSGRQGRPSRSLTFEQAVALITAAQEYALYAYVVLSLLVGLRGEQPTFHLGFTASGPSATPTTGPTRCCRSARWPIW